MQSVVLQMHFYRSRIHEDDASMFMCKAFWKPFVRGQNFWLTPAGEIECFIGGGKVANKAQVLLPVLTSIIEDAIKAQCILDLAMVYCTGGKEGSLAWSRAVTGCECDGKSEQMLNSHESASQEVSKLFLLRWSPWDLGFQVSLKMFHCRPKISYMEF